MARIIPVVIVLILIAAGIAKYKEAQKQNCTTGQCPQPSSTSITSKLRSYISPTATPPATASTPSTQPVPPSQSASGPSSSMLTPMEKARKEAFEAGKATGQSEGMQEIERREDKAREEGRETGLIEGEAKGHAEGIRLGEAVGYAKAAAEEFRKGQEQGERFGRLAGASEAQREMLQLIDEAEQDAEARGEKQGYVTGFTEGKETQRRESFYKTAGVATSVASLFAAMLFYTYTRLMPGSVAEYRKLEKERRELRKEALSVDAKYRDWVLAQWEDQKELLLTHDANSQEGYSTQPFPYPSQGATNGKH